MSDTFEIFDYYFFFENVHLYKFGSKLTEEKYSKTQILNLID